MKQWSATVVGVRLREEVRVRDFPLDLYRRRGDRGYSAPLSVNCIYLLRMLDKAVLPYSKQKYVAQNGALKNFQISGQKVKLVTISHNHSAWADVPRHGCAPCRGTSALRAGHVRLFV